MSVFSRKIQIDIDEHQPGILVLKTSLCDKYHDILLSLLVRVADFSIVEASVDMKKIPHSDCRKVYELMEAMKGCTVGPGFTRQVLKTMGGPQGCPNLVNLFLITAPLAINAAAVMKQEQESLTDEQMDEIWREILGGVCVAYPKKE